MTVLGKIGEVLQLLQDNTEINNKNVKKTCYHCNAQRLKLIIYLNFLYSTSLKEFHFHMKFAN